jgi:hypothetical protein
LPASIEVSNAGRDALVTCEAVDRAATLSFRPVGLSRGAIPALYGLARDDGPPLSYQIAVRLLELPDGAEVGILTGAAVPDFLPNGENDGPLGAVVLGNALQALGFRVTYLAESELNAIFNALFALYGASAARIELAKDDADDHARTAPNLDALISIEKLGANAQRVMHGATGYSREGTRAHVDGLVNRLNAAGKLTVGIGDGGNEVGFGKIYAAARELVDYGRECRCPCGDGIVTVTPTNILFPVGVSNWGAYAVTAALAALSGRLEIVHTPERERGLLVAAVSVDCRDGGTGEAREYVDGVPGETSAAIVQIFKTLATTATQRDARAF